jgi:hypothetical protein
MSGNRLVFVPDVLLSFLQIGVFYSIVSRIDGSRGGAYLICKNGDSSSPGAAFRRLLEC